MSAILMVAGSALSGSINSVRKGKKAVTTAGTTVTFSSPFTDASWQFIECFCLDSLGGRVEGDVTNVTANGFKFTPLTNGTLHYAADI